MPSSFVVVMMKSRMLSGQSIGISTPVHWHSSNSPPFSVNANLNWSQNEGFLVSLFRNFIRENNLRMTSKLTLRYNRSADAWCLLSWFDDRHLRIWRKCCLRRSKCASADLHRMIWHMMWWLHWFASSWRYPIKYYSRLFHWCRCHFHPLSYKHCQCHEVWNELISIVINFLLLINFFFDLPINYAICATEKVFRVPLNDIDKSAALFVDIRSIDWSEKK